MGCISLYRTWGPLGDPVVLQSAGMSEPWEGPGLGIPVDFRARNMVLDENPNKGERPCTTSS